LVEKEEMRTKTTIGNEAEATAMDPAQLTRGQRTQGHPGEGRSWLDPHSGKSHEEGIALLIALFFTLLTAGMVFAGTLTLKNSEKKTELSLRTKGQGRQFAEAGLIDALDWYRRQTTQPVTSFAPVLDTLSTPPILDTDDPTIGIVREFEIDRGVWGRYEIRKTVPNVLPLEPEVKDITQDRGASGVGTVWRLVSRAFIFNRRNGSVPYNQAPNQVLATETLETEIRRLTLVPPAQAAICVNSGSAINLSSGTKITVGTNTGLAYRQGSGTPTIGGGVTISGTPAQATLTTWNDDVESVFGVDEDTLRSMADYQITMATELPNPVPTNSIIFSDGNLILTAANPLKGTGILYVKGYLYVPYGTSSYFNGVIYATGNIYLYSPVNINGTVITQSNLYMAGSGDKSEVIYDDGILNSLMIEIGQYRFSSATYKHDLRGSLKIKKGN